MILQNLNPRMKLIKASGISGNIISISYNRYSSKGSNYVVQCIQIQNLTTKSRNTSKVSSAKKNTSEHYEIMKTMIMIIQK